MQNTALTYKGYPLRRSGNIICFGNNDDKYIVILQILESQKVQDVEVSTKVSVQLHSTDPNVSSKDRIIKQSSKNGLYPAMDIGYIWLHRALTGKN